MKEGYLAALAVIATATLLYSWGGPQGQEGGGYRSASASQQRSNCPPRRYRATQSQPDDDGEEYAEDPRWRRVRPRQSRQAEYPETRSRGDGITTAFRRP